jgi:hypothetical protein
VLLPSPINQPHTPPSPSQSVFTISNNSIVLTKDPATHRSPFLLLPSTTTDLPLSAHTSLRRNLSSDTNLRAPTDPPLSLSLTTTPRSRSFLLLIPSYLKQRRRLRNPKNKSVVKQVWKRRKGEKQTWKTKKEKTKINCLLFFWVFCRASPARKARREEAAPDPTVSRLFPHSGAWTHVPLMAVTRGEDVSSLFLCLETY